MSEFSSWRTRLVDVVTTGAGDMNVPCGGCTACCRSSMFIHIGPDETDTLAHIPRELLFRAPGRPTGHVVMGYDEHGCCPMLVDGRCSIYAHRPRTCRVFDCRVYAAADLPADDKPLITERLDAWSGLEPEGSVVRAVAFLREHPECFPDRRLPATNSQLAVAALVVSELFEKETPDPSDVRIALAG